MASVLKVVSRFKPRLPEKWKGGRIEKIANYFHNIITDYHTVYKETLQDMRDRPVKASIYLSLIGTTIALIKTNPEKQSFRENMMEYHNDLGEVNARDRNPDSVKFIYKVAEAEKDRRLRLHNLFLFTLARIDTCPSKMGLYTANCKQIKPHWTKFHESIVDVCVFGHWIFMERAMKNYDVNSAVEL